MNYWLIPMDFETCNYKDLEYEWNKNKRIMWQAHGTITKNTKIKKDSKAKKLKKGDIVYFYVTHLPSESNVRLSRIMLRGIIEDEPYLVEKNKVYMKSNDTSIIIGFSIGSLTTLCKDKLENNLFLCYKHLKEIDNDFIYPQGKNWPDKNINKNLSENIIGILEESFKSNLQKNDFKALIEHFERKCFFCGKYGVKNDHKTFVARNGLDYYEYHHFIPKYVTKKNLSLQEIVNSTSNGLYLCPNCHRKIHYGTFDEVAEMLEIILQTDDIQNMLKSSDFQDKIGKENNIMEWLQHAYKIKK